MLRERNFERILLIKPSAVGDVIHTLPVLAKLRARYPKARIDWLLTPAISELIERHPALSRAIHFDRHVFARWWRNWRSAVSLARFLARLRWANYDLVIDLHGQFRSALVALATGAPTRIGFDRPFDGPRSQSDRQLVAEAYRHGWTGAREGAWLAYTHRIRIPNIDTHAVDRYLWLGPLLGLDEGPPEFQVPVPPEAQARISTLLKSHGLLEQPLAVLVPGTLWETKHWHVEGFAQVAHHLVNTGRAVVLAGSPGERGRCKTVADLCPKVCDLSGQTTLSELAALLQRAEICVTNDSGSMHLAVALGRPVVSVFGPTDPVWIGPYRRPGAVVRAEVPCAPCYLRKVRRCPNGHACMQQVTANMVIECAERMLSDSTPNAA
jgi:lipopolysaccharide heptosyltransferase I